VPVSDGIQEGLFYMHEPTAFTETATGSSRTETAIQPRLVLVATTFLVLGFLLGACADQYKTFAGAYSDVIDIYRSCTFGP
jgi:hypothetical protein